ncbi:MAG: hypothetical protein LBR52_03780 [Prevotellaceae bacterium]|jgi:hypothetical protein|nr:hypothetical protein [Prevotellaceae bacterium]
MKKGIFILLFPVLAVTFCGCDEFIEKDLKGKKVTMLAPADSLVTSITTITFWWEEIEGASDYNLQVISPDFDRAEKLWADTFVVGNKLEISLVPGNYQWRIKGMNGSSETGFARASFSIDSTLNLTNETIVLHSPANNAVSNRLSQVFKWNKLYNANEYRFTITGSSNTLLKDEVTQVTENSFEFTDDGDYTWSVRGQNEISNTLYTSYTITIDTESPGKPTLKDPAIRTDTVRFEWTRVEENGSLLFDSLYVFRDADFREKVIAKKTDKTFYEELLQPGTYHWYVRTCDAAGNVSERSATSMFTKY